MTTNNTFSLPRLSLLLRQNLIHNYKLLAISMVAFSGGVFLLLLFIQATVQFRQVGMDTFMGAFFTIFVAGIVLSAGTAFPYLRTKEKSQTYLMLPASILEKFIVEFFIRVVLFVVMIPILYWVVFYIETSMISAITGFDINGGIPFDDLEMPSDPKDMKTIWFILFTSLTSSLFIIPFTGATVFNKNPLVKTLFALAIVVMFNAYLFYFFLEVLEFDHFHPADDTLLFISSPSQALTAATIASVLFNVALVTAAYFKLKEKEA